MARQEDRSSAYIPHGRKHAIESSAALMPVLWLGLDLVVFSYVSHPGKGSIETKPPEDRRLSVVVVLIVRV